MTETTPPPSRPTVFEVGVLALFVVVLVGVGGTIGVLTAPGDWYAALAKPPLNPPNWLFAPVWFTLYVMMAVAGWLVWRRSARGLAFRLWLGQQALNWLWSPIFFSLQWLWPAGIVIVSILGLIIAFIAVTWRSNRWAALLFVPYAAWVGFASYLNLSIAVLN